MSSKDNRVVVRTGNTLRTEVMTNGYTLLVDEPIGVGGTNSGPTPYDYLLAALGACTAMTLRVYADYKKWPEKILARYREVVPEALEEADGKQRRGVYNTLGVTVWVANAQKDPIKIEFGALGGEEVCHEDATSTR